MKQLIALAIIVVASIANAQSSYDILIPVRKVLTADITAVRNLTNPGLLPEVGVSGELVIDKRLKQVILNVRQQDLMDVTFSSNIYQTTLTLLTITKDETCGTVTYVAGTDPRALSRIVETLTIVDNTNNICEIADRRYAPTEMVLERTVNGIFLEQNSVAIDLTPLKRMSIE